MSMSLENKDRLAVVDVVQRLNSLDDIRGRKLLLELASLGRFSPVIDLSGARGTVAADVVLTLEKFGILPEQPAAHALGALLSYVLTLSDLSASDAQLVAGAIVKYSLINDPQYIADLRAKYNLAAPAPATAQFVAAAGAPVSEVTHVTEPTFSPALSDQKGLETIINSEDNFLDIGILTGALYCAQAVCRIEGSDGKALGTGVLIGPDLVLTNQHVLENKDHLEGAVARFNYQLPDGVGVPLPGKTFAFKTDFYHSSAADQLDYALAKLEAAPLKDVKADDKLAREPLGELVKAGKHRGYLRPVDRFLKARERVNIIQHPDGNPLKVVMTQNYVAADMSPTRLQYVADTMPGSSGSPVFNNNWELVALHHSGTPYPPDSVHDTLKKAWKGQFRVNEGIPMRAILADFKEKKLDSLLPL